MSKNQDISVDLTGVKLGSPKDPSIRTVSTWSQFNDMTDQMTDTEARSGAQLHMFTNPHDTLVVHLPNDSRGDQNFDHLAHYMDSNRFLWANEGVSLSAPDQVVSVSESYNLSPGQKRTEFGTLEHRFGGLELQLANLHQEGRGKAVLSVLRPEVLNYFDDSNGLQAIAKDQWSLEDKWDMYQALLDTSISQPKTVLSSDVAELDSRRTYVIKPRASAGGNGLVTDENGMDTNKTTLKVFMEGKKGLIQEFVHGQTYGAIAVFDTDGNFGKVYVHEQSPGISYSRSIPAEAKEGAQQIFEALSSELDFNLVGPINVDYKSPQGGPVLLEINPRYSGGTPLAYVEERFDPDCASIEKLAVPTDKIDRFVSAVSAINQTTGARILPQGLVPNYGVNLVVMNDPEGVYQKQVRSILQNN